jgi:hypothetical protein
MPVASSVNFRAGEVVPNTVIAPLGQGGAVCVYPQQDLDLLVDVAGYVGPTTNGFVPVAPERLVDTRNGLGGGRLAASGRLSVPVVGRAGVPAGAAAVALNVTATSAAYAGYVTAWPCDQPQPDASILNIVPGVNRANNAIVPLGPSGQVCLFTFGPLDVIVDISGWYGAGGGHMQAIVPSRHLDTRLGQGGYGRPGAGQIVTIDVAGRDGIPAAARAVRVNLTASTPGAPTYVTAYPCARTTPAVSNLNLEPAAVVRANGATVPLSPAGQLCLYTFAGTDLLLDVEGYVV